MKCFSHSDVDAVGVCKSCGKGVCHSCARVESNGVVCSDACAQSWMDMFTLQENTRQIQKRFQKSGASMKTPIATGAIGGILAAMGLAFIVTGDAKGQPLVIMGSGLLAISVVLAVLRRSLR